MYARLHAYSVIRRLKSVTAEFEIFMNEKTLEKKLREEVNRSRGLAVKIASAYYTGLPDRLVLMPGGRLYWVEMKSPGKDLSPRQSFVKKELAKLEFDVTKIDNENDLNNFLKRIGA